KNPERVAAGLKGTLKNDNVSEAAKERASERLQGLGVGVEDVCDASLTSSAQLKVMLSYSAVVTAPRVRKGFNSHHFR
ncbi:hypothetical protein GYMLUDRAFT_170583, partial [Collybiopsis luxurians FD-317 M1]